MGKKIKNLNAKKLEVPQLRNQGKGVRSKGIGLTSVKSSLEEKYGEKKVEGRRMKKHFLLDSVIKASGVGGLKNLGIDKLEKKGMWIMGKERCR